MHGYVWLWLAAGGLGLWLVLAYNRLVRARNLVREAWSGIDVQLKRRYDLIPRLLQAAQEYMEHERGLLTDVAELRGRCMRAVGPLQKAGPETALSGLLKNLVAVVEAYPDLKANQTILELQQNLTRVEDQIQMARRYYNGAVREYNIRTESFPTALVARAFGFRPAEYFEIELATERSAPELRL